MAPFRAYSEEDGVPRLFPCSSCEQQGWAARKRVQQEATQVFGDWIQGVPAFIERHGTLPTWAGVDATDEEAAASWAKYVEWLGHWNEFLAGRGEWTRAKLAAAMLEVRRACSCCNGTGMEVRTYWSGYFDYAGADSRWGALNKARRVENAFIGGQVPFRLLAEGPEPGAFTTGAALKSLVPRNPFQIGTDLLLPNENWKKMEPGLWGIYELPPAERHLTFYASDERWPLFLSEHLPTAVADDDACAALDCHT